MTDYQNVKKMFQEMFWQLKKRNFTKLQIQPGFCIVVWQFTMQTSHQAPIPQPRPQPKPVQDLESEDEDDDDEEKEEKKEEKREQPPLPKRKEKNKKGLWQFSLSIMFYCM